MLRTELGDLQQTPILLASTAHREADAAKAQQHHRPGRRFRDAPARPPSKRSTCEMPGVVEIGAHVIEPDVIPPRVIKELVSVVAVTAVQSGAALENPDVVRNLGPRVH